MMRTAVVFALTLGLFAAPAIAADADHASKDAKPAERSAADSDDSILRPVEFGPAARGSILPGLYASLAGLQAFDAHTTLAGVRSGSARESNPIVGGLASNSAAMWALKGGATAASIVVAEKLWKQRRHSAAIATMAITNGMMAAIAARNASVLAAVR